MCKESTMAEQGKHKERKKKRKASCDTAAQPEQPQPSAEPADAPAPSKKRQKTAAKPAEQAKPPEPAAEAEPPAATANADSGPPQPLSGREARRKARKEEKKAKRAAAKAQGEKGEDAGEPGPTVEWADTGRRAPLFLGVEPPPPLQAAPRPIPARKQTERVTAAGSPVANGTAEERKPRKNKGDAAGQDPAPQQPLTIPASPPARATSAPKFALMNPAAQSAPARRTEQPAQPSHPQAAPTDTNKHTQPSKAPAAAQAAPSLSPAPATKPADAGAAASAGPGNIWWLRCRRIISNCIQVSPAHTTPNHTSQNTQPRLLTTTTGYNEQHTTAPALALQHDSCIISSPHTAY